MSMLLYQHVKCLVVRAIAILTIAMSIGFSSFPCEAGGIPVAFEDASSRIPFSVVSFEADGNAMTGVAWFDYNNDGWLDLFVVNGCGHDNGLFENDGDGTFTEVGAAAMIQNGLGNNGVIAGDIDNDGFQDLFLTGEGGYLGTCNTPDLLYRNNGDGTFSDITASAGIVGPGESFSAAFGDINNDSFLDLFITANGQQSGEGPRNKLYINNGDLTFSDISASACVDTDEGACAAFFSDYNADGFLDLFVANCVPFIGTGTFELFRNLGDETFVDVAPIVGIDVPAYWMAAAPGDIDNDGDIDFFSTNLGTGFNFPNVLFRNNGDLTYTDIAAASETADFEFGWGATLNDFDNDGFADIFYAGADPTFTIGVNGNPGRMFFNNQDSTFTDFTSSMPLDMRFLSTAGVASGDFDNDGFPDIAVANDSFGAAPGQPILLHSLGNDNNSLTVRLQGTVSNRDGVGARVIVTTGSQTLTREVYAGTSFLSMDSQWLTFGLGANTQADEVVVRWPSRRVDRFVNVSAGQMFTVVEGTGLPCENDAHCDNGLPCTISTCDAGTCETIEPAPGCTGCVAPASPAIDTLITSQGESVPSTRARFLSVRVGESGATNALRVRLNEVDPDVTHSNAFAHLFGSSWWVGQPQAVSEAQTRVECLDGDICFWAAPLQCEPVALDWSQFDVIHVFGEPVIPGATYNVQLANSTCSLNAETSFSDPLLMNTTIWGDVTAGFDGTVWLAPDASMDIADVLAVLRNFSVPGNPGKTRTDFDTSPANLSIDIADALETIRAFQGLPYSFAPPDPCSN